MAIKIKKHIEESKKPEIYDKIHTCDVSVLAQNRWHPVSLESSR